MFRQTNYSDEDELIKGCLKGKAKAQKHLYDAYAPRMYPIAMRYAKTTLEADDILQESFIKIFENIAQFKQDCPLEFWIKRIVINTALKQNRKKIEKAHTEEVSDLNYKPNQHTDQIVASLNYEALLKLIQQLAPRYQMVFNLYAIEGYKHKEIADMLDITEGTSKSQYARAKVILQELIAKEDMQYEQLKEQQ
ncbi:MAG: RNA polymerase sigma factor [Bernardetiaceae bacterium]|nr:RNA polymerase sigma factor [Bernardetiaceae bacterium]